MNTIQKITLKGTFYSTGSNTKDTKKMRQLWGKQGIHIRTCYTKPFPSTFKFTVNNENVEATIIREGGENGEVQGFAINIDGFIKLFQIIEEKMKVGF
ncbi:MAG: hypothetical protein QNJ31_03755 [Candidatus Caenarcaniphilales bacterium]|nr:hypothetical protein [Candidatus Caenarcaniphilales bacterium]